jgi:hypothetical protein
VTKNGTTQDTSGRRKNSEREDERIRLGEHGQNSQVYGINQIGITSFDSSRENSTWTDRQGSSDPGKILERLELIEKTFLSYVRGHQDRLEARLEESKNVESVFREEVQALKQEIYCLSSTTNEETNP